MKGVYTIYDRLAEKASPLFEADNNVLARRQFVGFCRTTHSKDDFSLIRVANWDYRKMELKDAGNELIMEGSEVTT